MNNTPAFGSCIIRLRSLLNRPNALTCPIMHCQMVSIVPYSGKFSPEKNFAKPRCVVLQENFTRFIFAHMRMGEIKFHGIINNYSFQHSSLAVSSSLKKCLAAAESPISLAIWTSVHYLAPYKALSSPL